jgi:hypothetical protein
MSRSIKRNVCPVCWAQGRLRISVDYFECVKFVEYIVTCNCHVKPVPMPSKKWAWWWFRNWRTVKMRDLQNYQHQADVFERNDARYPWRALVAYCYGIKPDDARLKHS